MYIGLWNEAVAVWRWTAGMAQMENPLFTMDILSHLRFCSKTLSPHWRDMPLRWLGIQSNQRYALAHARLISNFSIHHCILGIGIPTHFDNWKPLQHWTTDSHGWALKEYSWRHAAEDYSRWKGAKCAAITRGELRFSIFCYLGIFFFFGGHLM